MMPARLPPLTPAALQAAIAAPLATDRVAGELASQAIVLTLAEHRSAILRRRRIVEAPVHRNLS